MPLPVALTVSGIGPPDQQIGQTRPLFIADGILEARDLSHGMVSAVPRALRPIGSASFLQDARVREDWIGRRWGYKEFLQKPSSSSIIRLVNHHSEDGNNYIIRVAHGTLYITDDNADWHKLQAPHNVEFVFDIRADDVSAAQTFGHLYLANYYQRLLLVDPVANEILEIPRAPKCKYIAAFADRIIGAFLNDPVDGILPFGLQWSRNGNPAFYTGEGSGRENLVSSPSDTGDEITGLFTFGSVIVIFRERSIWLGTRQPFSLAPFRFDAVVTNLGCDMPKSIARLTDVQGRLTGFIFGDSRTGSVYSYTPGADPIEVPGSSRIGTKLLEGLVNPKTVRGTYDPYFKEYHFGFPTNPNELERLQKFWVMNLENNSISQDTGPPCTSIDSILSTSRTLPIDEIQGNVDDLPSFIDKLGVNPVLSLSFIVKGAFAGESLQEDDSEQGDHLFVWQSQDLSSLAFKRTFRNLRIKASSASEGEIFIEWTDKLGEWIKAEEREEIFRLFSAGKFDSIKQQFNRLLWVGSKVHGVEIGSKGLNQWGQTEKPIYFRVTANVTQFKMLEWWTRLYQDEGVVDKRIQQ